MIFYTQVTLIVCIKKAIKWPNVHNNRTINWTNVQNSHNLSHILMILLQKFLINIKLLGDNSRTRDTNHQSAMKLQHSKVREYLQNILWTLHMVLKRQSERKWKPTHGTFSEDSDPLVRTESGKGVQSGSQGCSSPSWTLWIDKGHLHFDIY